MKRDSTPAFVLSAVFAGLLGFGLWRGPSPARTASAGDAQMTYESAAEVTLTGVVVGMPRVHRATSPVLVMLRTAPQPIDLVLAPASYLSEMDLTLIKGDQVRVIGVKGLLNDEEVIFVREITKGTRTVAVRDPCGAPLWVTRSGSALF